MPGQYALSPTGHFRNVWDFFGIVLLVLDCIILPLQIVKEDFDYVFPLLALSSTVALAYWIVDMVLSFFTAFPDRGSLVLERRRIAYHYLRRIACHYLRTWFVPDLVVTTIDLILEFSVAVGDADRATTKALRLLRLCRVVRLGKLTHIAAFLRDKFESQVASIQFSLVLVMMGMVLTEHVIACGWFGIAIFNSGAGTWLNHTSVKDASFAKQYTTSLRWGTSHSKAFSHLGTDASFVEQYTTSLRWSFSSLGIGGTNVEATNETEGVYSVVVGLISLVTFSTIVSSMTSLVSTLHSGRMEEIQQFGLLRRYLRMNKIPAPLGQRITRFLQYTYHHRESNCRDPSILGYLSTSLQSELLFAKYSPYLAKLPFLGGVLPNFLSAREEQVMQTLARTGVSIVAAAENDAIFCSGAKADTAYFAMQGSLVYMCENSPEAVNHERWVSEMCLWTDWWHVGDLLSAGIGKIAMIHATEFCHILSNMDNLQRQARCYATDYVQALNQTVDATDLWQMPEEEGTDAEQPESVWSRAFGGVHVVPA
ncbi:unnamed protein product [Effrenium voratum]|nr:unnamed protein product [Effrenium voratum]